MLCWSVAVVFQINTAESLVLTELLFEGMLTDLSSEECVALLSALIFKV